MFVAAFLSGSQTWLTVFSRFLPLLYRVRCEGTAMRAGGPCRVARLWCLRGIIKLLDHAKLAERTFRSRDEGDKMTQDVWTAVDKYITDLLVPSDPALDAALQAASAAGLPPIQVSAVQGKLLHLLARACGARQVLEIGSLGGYSTIWLARALPAGGRVVTLEADAKHAEVARANFALAGLAGVIELRLGPALETLPKLAAEGRGPFDLIFIDADKANM